jgi:predicted transcriptional regulator
MPQKTISPRHIKGLIVQHAIHYNSTASIALSLKIARSTVRAYIELYDNSALVNVDISNLSADSIAASIKPQNYIYKHSKYFTLCDHFFQYHERLKDENTNMKNLWHEYNQKEPSGLTPFAFVLFPPRQGQIIEPGEDVRARGRIKRIDQFKVGPLRCLSLNRKRHGENLQSGERMGREAPVKKMKV